MDIITQRFIAIGNRLLAELRGLRDSLQKNGEAISKQACAQEEHDKTPPVLRAELQIPQTVIDEHRAKTTEKERREKWKFWVEVITCLAVIAYATVAAFQWCTMNRTLQQATQQADIANQQLRAGRAYFVLTKYDTVPMYSAEGNKGRLLRYHITATYENLGNTPATDVEMILDLVPVRKIGDLGSPDHPITLDIPDWEHRKGPRIPISVAPHAIVVGTVEVSIEQAMQVDRGEIYLILWTKAQYQDIFDKATIHHSGTCVELIPYADLRSGAPFKFQLASRIHNYADGSGTLAKPLTSVARSRTCSR